MNSQWKIINSVSLVLFYGQVCWRETRLRAVWNRFCTHQYWIIANKVNSYIMCVQINNYLVNKREYYSWSLDYWCVASIEFQLLRSSCRFELVMSVGLRVGGESQLISRPAGVSAAELSTRRQSRSIEAKVLVDEKDQFLLVGTILNIVKVQYFHS